jgi:uncharacterized cupredoxin-like copper-binding protein
MTLMLIGAACSGGDQAVTALDDPDATNASSSGDPVAAGNDTSDPVPSTDDSAAAESAPESGDDEEPMEGHTDGGSMGNEPTEGTDGVLVIAVEMNEFGYELAETTIPAGSTVRFDFVNVGVIEHEAMFGTVHEQEEFADSAAHGEHGGEGHHGTVPAITLGAGEVGSLIVEFDEPGEVMIGCHLPGHWVAGMVTTLTVVA